MSGEFFMKCKYKGKAFRCNHPEGFECSINSSCPLKEFQWTLEMVTKEVIANGANGCINCTQNCNFENFEPAIVCGVPTCKNFERI